MYSDCGASCSSSCMNVCAATCGRSCSGCAGSSNLCSNDYSNEKKEVTHLEDYDLDRVDITDKVAINMACELCGGMMQLQNEIGHHVLYCPYCHAKRVLI